MRQQWYELIDDKKPQRPAVRRRRQARALWASLGAIVLIVVAIYAPALIDAPLASAEPFAVSRADAPESLGESSLLGDFDALADLYDSVAPSIVNIRVSSRESTAALPGFNGQDSESPLLQSQGSGFVYDENGHIVTNNHVVEDAETVLVIFYNGLWADAEVVAADPQADLAVIKVTPPAGLEWRVLPIDESDGLRVGHMVVAIGNPFGLAGTMTTGVVSALGRGIPVGDETMTRYTLPDVIQTDAAINPGNSGGPLVDLNGNVVGVNFAIRSQVRSNSGVGFAVPASVVRRVVPALIETGRFDYAYLGLSGSSISADLSGALGLPEGLLGVYVAEVIPDGPSAGAGLRGGTVSVNGPGGGLFRQGGDIITAIDGVSVQRFEDLVSYLVTRAAPGQRVSLTVIRNGNTMDVDVTLGERPAFAVETATVEQDGDINAREAIAIATEAVADSGLLQGDVEERVATPDEMDGVSVWVVELTAGSSTATVIVDAATGEVLEMDIR